MFETLLAYTDGSTALKNPGIAGSACVLQVDDDTYKVMTQHIGLSTNNVAELTAVSLLLGWLLNNQEYLTKKIVIHTDSEYTLGVCSGAKRASANKELVLHIHDLIKTLALKGMIVEFKWVRAHANDALNNTVDALAKYATQSSDCHTIYNGVKSFTKAEFIALKQSILKGAVHA